MTQFNMKYYTYQVLNQSNGKKYFGFTTNPEQRWKKHLDGIKAKKKSCPYFHNALKKGPKASKAQAVKVTDCVQFNLISTFNFLTAVFFRRENYLPGLHF